MLVISHVLASLSVSTISLALPAFHYHNHHHDARSSAGPGATQGGVMLWFKSTAAAASSFATYAETGAWLQAEDSSAASIESTPPATPSPTETVISHAVAANNIVTVLTTQTTAPEVTPAPVVVTTAAPPPPVVPPPADPATPDQAEWISAHNTARAQYGAGIVSWNPNLALRAKANADLCTGQHSNSGENIASSSGGLTPQKSVDMWMGEAGMYDFSNPAFSDGTGHFTQVVWKASTEIGCWTSQCQPGSTFNASFGVTYQASCEYNPPGNFVNAGQFAANVGGHV